MKICHYNSKQAGVVDSDKVYPIGDALVKAGHVRSGYTMLEVIDALANQPTAMQCAREALKSGSPVPLSAVKLLAPIYNPGSLWAAAANYKAHQAEMRIKMGSADRAALSPDELMAEFFLKPTSSIIGPGDTVILPKISKDVDFECELCAVIGKKARNVTENNALDYVFGYTCVNDVTARDLQKVDGQFTRGKGFDTFCPMGPLIAAGLDPSRLGVETFINGERRQAGRRTSG